MSEEQNKAPNEGEARVLSDDELKGIVGGVAWHMQTLIDEAVQVKDGSGHHEGNHLNITHSYR